jgi:hypothetical protein
MQKLDQQVCWAWRKLRCTTACPLTSLQSRRALRRPCHRWTEERDWAESIESILDLFGALQVGEHLVLGDGPLVSAIPKALLSTLHYLVSDEDDGGRSGKRISQGVDHMRLHLSLRLHPSLAG